MVDGEGDSRLIRARVWWALLAQPGDRVVGELLDDLGPIRAAQRLRAIHRGSLPSSASSTVVSRDEMRHLANRYPNEPSGGSVDQVLDHALRWGISLITPESPHWPSRLDDLGPHRPIILFVAGDIGVLSPGIPPIAVVGTRKPSVPGATAGRLLAESLSQAGHTIVSGGALGIDAIAHRAAIRQGRPTIVVAATGLERAYPREHTGLFEAVSRNGAIVTETPARKPISPRSFLARNRVIAALAAETVVVECPAQSGSLSTASHAATLGRELWAVRYATWREENEGASRLFEEWGAREIPESSCVWPGSFTNRGADSAIAV